MKVLPKVFFLICLLSTSILGYTAEPPSALMSAWLGGKNDCIDKKSGASRSGRVSWVQQIAQQPLPVYKAVEQGRGDYDKYKDVTWEAVCQMKEEAGFLVPQYHTHIIKDNTGQVVINYQKTYDYAKKKIYFKALDAEGKVVSEKTFPIKGRTVDNVSLSYFLKKVIANIDDKEHLRFYLLSNEPKLYKINVKKIASETMDTPLGKKEVVKIRLIPDFGIMTKVLGALVPPTFFWYTNETHPIFVKYEGLESGLGTPHVVVTLTQPLGPSGRR